MKVTGREETEGAVCALESVTKFYAVGSFLVRGGNLFVVVGDVLEGEVAAGMMLQIPLHGELSIGSRVASVEYLDVREWGKAYVGLTVECSDPEEREILAALELGGKTLRLKP